MWTWDEDRFEEIEVYDPLEFVRNQPVDDEQAELIEAICQTATPGPLVIDDVSEGGGVLVASLPDGRHIVSLRPVEGSPQDARAAAVANAQLVCEARGLLLRLLHDREAAKNREASLLERIQALEDQLQRLHEPPRHSAWTSESPIHSRPR